MTNDSLWILYQTYKQATDEKNHERAKAKDFHLFSYFYKQNGEAATLELAAEGEPIRDLKPISQLPKQLAEELHTIEEMLTLSKNPDQYEDDYCDDEDDYLEDDDAVAYYFWQCAKDRLRDFQILAKKHNLNMSAYDYFDDDYEFKPELTK
tara:strand:- start:573 stop:1025 length:453 start_codon:yes stop_codon:yes gene_type:complete